MTCMKSRESSKLPGHSLYLDEFRTHTRFYGCPRYLKHVNGSARVYTTLCIDFSDAEGQLTPLSVVEYVWMKFKLLWLSSLHVPVRTKEIK